MEVLEDRLAPAVFTVDLALDESDGNISPGDLSLREAVALANATGGADEIRFAAGLNGTALTLILGELLVTDSVRIIGNGGTNTIISGNRASRVFRLDNSSASLINVDFEAMTLRAGSATGTGISGSGGAVLNSENLTVRNCLITDSFAGFNGGGVYNQSGTLAIFDSSITLNQVNGNGGGLYNDTGAASLTNCFVFENFNTGVVSGNGGGLHNQTGTLTVLNCTVAGNRNGSDPGGNGGGLFNFTGTVTITGSTFSNNTSTNNGGALQSLGGTIRITNSTLSGNQANFGGGAILNQGATTTITNSTITNNRADRDGGGVPGTGGGVRILGGTVTLRNTIVAGNFVGAAPGTTADDINGSVTANFSLIGINTGATISGGNNLVGSGSPLDPLLGALANNGGPTETHALAANSPALNAGSNALAVDVNGFALATDQRGPGFVRIIGGTVDIGAVEFGTANGAPQTLYAVGADAGALPHVRVFNANGSLRFEFFAYAASFRGGVRVATGDVTGDGIPDLITGAGPGAGPHVKVFSGANASEVRSFFAFAPNFLGGVFVDAGDVTGDSRADIVVGADAGAFPHVAVFDAVTQALVRSFFAFDAGFRGGVRVAAGDVNNDGRADIIAAAGPGAGPHVRSFDSTTLAVIDSFFAYDATFAGGVYVSAGDVDGDGRADLITGAGPGAGPHVKVFRSQTQALLRSFFAYTTPLFMGGVRVGAVDRNADGRQDILTGPGPGGGPHLRVFDGNTLAVLDSFFAFNSNFFGGIFVG